MEIPFPLLNLSKDKLRTKIGRQRPLPSLSPHAAMIGSGRCQSWQRAGTTKKERYFSRQDMRPPPKNKPPFSPRGGYYRLAVAFVSIVAPSGAEGGLRGL